MNCFKGKYGPYIIAEIGGNHEGDFEYAKRLTELAVRSGADAVKYQLYTGDSLVNRLEDLDRNKHFKKFQLRDEQYIELAEICSSFGVTFMASVWNIDAFDFIDPYMKVYKIGSGDLTAYNVIKRTVETGKPIIMSTGLSTMTEVLETVKFITGLDKSYITDRKLALMQCSAMYPIPDEDANLNVMLSLREKTSLPVGYSDHTLGTDALETAAAMGAEILEMHFTDTRQHKTFRDHKIALTAPEIENLIEKIKKIYLLQGNYDKKPVTSEIQAGHVISFRRGVYPLTDLPAGHKIDKTDLVTLRPCHGIGANHFYEIVGKTLKIDVKKLQLLGWNMFD